LGHDYCPAHDPNRVEARKRAASRAARAGHGGDLREVKDRLKELAEDVLGGRVDRGDAAVASQVLNVYLRAVSVEQKLREVQELEQRLAQLEEALA
jgi:glutathione S-transferase